MTFNELVKSGVLTIGTELVWKRRIQGETHTATVAQGAIRTADGKLHKSPSGAARHLNNGKPVDGWKVWKIKESGVSIDSFRLKPGESLGE
jgi:Restriction Enzyme Adenine Methylase Associated